MHLFLISSCPVICKVVSLITTIIISRQRLQLWRDITSQGTLGDGFPFGC